MLVCYYGVSIPSCYLLAFKYDGGSLGLVGTWSGLLIGQGLLYLFSLYVVFIHYNWVKVAIEVKERTEHDEKKRVLLESPKKN